MNHTAIVVMGMTSTHWCSTYKAAMDELAGRLNGWLWEARERGKLVVHATGEQDHHFNTVPLRSWHCACGTDGTCVLFDLPEEPHPAIEIGPDDWKIRYGIMGVISVPMNIHRLLYVGAGADHSVLFHPSGAVPMREFYDVALVRDMLLSFSVRLGVPLSHALSRYKIPSVESAYAL